MVVVKRKVKGLNLDVLLKGENYKSKYVAPPVIRSSRGFHKRYNSVE